MKKIFTHKITSKLIRISLGAILIYASLDKLANTADFAKIIYYYRMLPAGVENLPAIFLPWLELITGLCLIFGKFTRGALLIYSSLLVIFVIALGQALLRGLDISCGCFNVKSSATSEIWLQILQDLILFFFSVNLYRSMLNKGSAATDISEKSA
jgi:uncharacterized membrane protein YphA (DoxX/SURF4 family)